MSYLRALPGVLILLLFGTANAPAQTTLKHKYAEGTQFKTQVTNKLDETLNINGKNVPTKLEMKVGSQTFYGKRDANNNVSITSKIESIRATLSAQGMSMTFDSALPGENTSNQQSEPFVDQLRRLNGLVISYKVNPERNKIVSVEQPKGGSPIDPEELKNRYQQELEMYPIKPLKPGDKWELTVNQDLGQGQVLTCKRNYEYVGEVPEFATVPGSRILDKVIASDSSVDYSIDIKAGVGKIKSRDLKIESKHTYLFDREAGRTVDTDSEVRVSGILLISINNIDLEAMLDLTLTSRVQEVK
jgi:hypothetical protein